MLAVKALVFTLVLVAIIVAIFFIFVGRPVAKKVAKACDERDDLRSRLEELAQREEAENARLRVLAEEEYERTYGKGN